MLNFGATLSALVYTLAQECSPGLRSRPFVENRVVRFVAAQHAQTPDFLRLPLRVLTLVFDAWPLLTTGRTFHRLAPEARGRQIAGWRASRLGFRRDFVRYYEGLAVFGWYACLDSHVSPA